MKVIKIKGKWSFWSRVLFCLLFCCHFVLFFSPDIILEIFVWDLFLSRIKIIIYPPREEHKIWVTIHLELLGMKIPNFCLSGAGGHVLLKKKKSSPLCLLRSYTENSVTTQTITQTQESSMNKILNYQKHGAPHCSFTLIFDNQKNVYVN